MSFFFKTIFLLLKRLFKSKLFSRYMLIFISLSLVNCGPPVYKNLTLLKTYDDNIKYVNAIAGKNGAPAVEDIVGERFFNLFVLSPKGNSFIYENKTYQHRAKISQNSDGTFKLITSPIQFGAMPLAPIFEFSKLRLVKLENGTYSFVAKTPGTGVFFSLPNSAYPYGYPMANYKNIKFLHAGTEIQIVTANGKKYTMLKFAFELNQDIKTLPNGYLNIQAIINKNTPGFKDFSDKDIKKLNDLNARLLTATTRNKMGTQMRAAAGTHCDYRIEFQGYRLKYTGIKTRPYLFNKSQSKFKRLARTRVCDYETHLSGIFLDLDYKPIANAKITILDKKNQTPILNTSTPLKTNVRGEFKISSKDYPQLKGEFFRGFVKLMFEYEVGGVQMRSYYPKSTTYEDSEVLKMQPNGYTNIIAEMPDTSIRVKPISFGGGISGNHIVKLYKDTNDNLIKTQQLTRSLAVKGSDKSSNFYDYTTTFKNLNPGKYFIELKTNDSNKSFWYIGKDALNTNNIIKAPNNRTDAAPIMLKKDAKLTISPTLAKELTTNIMQIPYLGQHNIPGAVYDYKIMLIDSNDEILESLSDNYIYYRNVILGSDFKLSIKRRKCIRKDYQCSSFGKTQWLKHLKIIPVGNYSFSTIKMTLNKSEARKFTPIYLSDDHDYKDEEYPGYFNRKNTHGFLIRHDPHL